MAATAMAKLSLSAKSDSLPLVVILDSSSHDVEEQVLKDYAIVKSYNAKSAADLPDEISEAKGVLLWHTLKADAELLKKLDSCKIIVRLGSGYDNVDLKAAAELSIFVSNVPNYGTEEVADSALSHILNLYRRTYWCAQFVSKGGKAHGPDEIAVVAGGAKRIRGQVLGIIGLGRIGIAVVQRAKAFGFEIVFYDPFVCEGLDKALGIQRVTSLDKLLATADCISLHCELNDTTRNIINSVSLSQCKKGVLIVNTARGELIEEKALACALKEGQVAGAALDVHQVEPFDDSSPLFAAPNLISTPHSAYYSDQSAVELRSLAAQEILRCLQEQKLKNCVNGSQIERMAWEKLMLSRVESFTDGSTYSDEEETPATEP